MNRIGHGMPCRGVVAGLALLAGCCGVAGAGLQWQAIPGGRYAEVDVPSSGRTGFTRILPATSGIHFTNDLSFAAAERNQTLLDGAGVAAGDVDGDGLPDLYFCQLEGASALYRNLGGFRFDDVTAEHGVGCADQNSMGAVLADVNGDGWQDLLVVALTGPNHAFYNDGRGRLTNATAMAAITSRAGCHGMALGDVDGDGALDLYVVNYGDTSILRSGGEVAIRTINGRPTVVGRYARRLRVVGGKLVEMGLPDVLFRNDGRGRFTAASWTDGTFLDAAGAPLKAEPYDMGLTAMFRDINRDGAPDLYVCNDFQNPDRIWINDGRGRFRALGGLALRRTSHFSMGVDFGDLDRDGRDEIFVCDMLSRFHHLRMTQVRLETPTAEMAGEPQDRYQARNNTLFWNRGDGTWAEIAAFAGVAASDWSWTPVFLDVDLDGYEDLLVSNGHAYDTQDLDAAEKTPDPRAASSMQGGKRLVDFPRLLTPNYAFRNRGNLTFDEMGAAWGFDSTQVSHGVVTADLDQDGDLDVVVSCLATPPLVYRNESTAPRVAVRLKGVRNTAGIGARIRLFGGAVPEQSQEMISGGRFHSSDESLRVFAAGSVTNRMRLEVTWRDGRRTTIDDVRANRIYEVAESAAAPVPAPVPPRPPAPRFSAVDTGQSVVHDTDPFDDLSRQALLLRRASAEGPSVAWLDLDDDGRDELVVGAGRHREPGIFRVSTAGALAPFAWSVPRRGSHEWRGLAPLGSTLLAAIGETENGPAREAVEVLAVDGGRLRSALLELPAATLASVLAATDADGDGQADLFVGGRALPGQHPLAAPSMVLSRRAGAWVMSQVWTNLGPVTAAVWSDLNADGFPELVVAADWQPLRILRNDRGRLAAGNDRVVDPAGGGFTNLAGMSGWWNGVTAGDFDGDGRMDLLAANWGLNTLVTATRTGPLRLFYGDLTDAGRMDQIAAEVEPTTGRSLPLDNLVALNGAVPWIRGRFPTHASASRASIEELLAERFAALSMVECTTLASWAFYNRGDHFQAVQLPREVQWAAGFGVAVADFDGDGTEDAFVSQNFAQTRVDYLRCDNGRGVLLLNGGATGLRAVPDVESGLGSHGEGRGVAVADFDRDGRIDLALAEHRGPLRLFRNTSARPGLRVRLKGTGGNPAALGAAARLRSASGLGPAREWRGGAGYGCVDGAEAVLASPVPATHVWVRWPGGAVTETPVPAGAAEITIAAPAR